MKTSAAAPFEETQDPYLQADPEGPGMMWTQWFSRAKVSRG